jgi:aminomethyltransferase
MVEFGGWKMPVQYSGPEAAKLMDYVTTNWASRLKCGRARYSGRLYEHGGFVDDILAHKVADDSFFLCVNASNQEKDFVHMQAANKFDCVVELAGDRSAQLAIQGPKAQETAQQLTEIPLTRIKYYRNLRSRHGK